MSKPTQAQIEARQCQDNALEAAAKQIHHELGCTITAARIAAAKALTAAAEVGEKGLASLPPEEQRKAHEWMDRKLIATTIERCAQNYAGLIEAIDKFSKATSRPDGPSLAMQRHDATWGAWKNICHENAQIEAAKSHVQKLFEVAPWLMDLDQPIAGCQGVTWSDLSALAAAEVGEKNPSLYYRSLEAATIERCAQVAENWKQGGSTESKGIAAAIRALKISHDPIAVAMKATGYGFRG